MRKGAANKLILGMFVTIALGLFIGAIYYMGKQRKLFGESIKVTARFSHVGGLMIGNNVRFAGINVGTVDNIAIINDSTVEVTMVLEKKVQPFVRKDSKALIGAEGLMGNKLVNILPGTSTVASVEANDRLPSGKAVDFEDVLKNLERTSENAVVISQELAELTQKVNNSNGTLSRFLYDSTFAEIIENSLRNVERGTYGFSENMEAMKSNFLFRGYYKRKEKEKEEAAKLAKEKKEGKENSEDEKDAEPRKKNRLKFWK